MLITLAILLWVSQYLVFFPSFRPQNKMLLQNSQLSLKKAHNNTKFYSALFHKKKKKLKTSVHPKLINQKENAKRLVCIISWEGPAELATVCLLLQSPGKFLYAAIWRKLPGIFLLENKIYRPGLIQFTLWIRQLTGLSFLGNERRPTTNSVTCCFPQQTHAGRYSPLGSLASPFPSFKLLSFWLKTSLLLCISDSNTMETDEQRPIYLRRHQINCHLQKSEGLDEDKYLNPHRAEKSLVCTWKETEEMEGIVSVPDPERPEGKEELIVHDSLLQYRRVSYFWGFFLNSAIEATDPSWFFYL